MAGIEHLEDSRELTAALISRPLDWRVRVVEEITVDEADSCLRRRSLQAAPLRAIIEEALERPVEGDEAWIGLFVAPVARGPLLEFSIDGPLGQAMLLPRLEIAERQALYLDGLISASGRCASEGLKRLLVSACSFVSTAKMKSDDDSDVRQYLADGLGHELDDQTFRAWRSADARCKQVLRSRSERFSGMSAPETPSLSVPLLYPDGSDDAAGLLDEYASLLEDLASDAPSGPSASEEFLNSLADYANNYDLLVATRVPLDEPFLVKFEERRRMSLSAVRNIGEQEIVVADAQSNHVAVRVPDPSTRIKSFNALQTNSDADAVGAFASPSRVDAQTRSFYAFDSDRDYRIRLLVGLAPLRRLMVANWFVVGVLVLVTIGLWIERPYALADLALVTGLSGAGASLLLSREQNTLGSRLRRAESLSVAVAVVILVLTAACLFVVGQVHDSRSSSNSTCESTISSERGSHGEEHRSRLQGGRCEGP